jgi:TPR repeat protein
LAVIKELYWTEDNDIILANFGLGRMYMMGQGVPVDRERAVQLLDRAASLGCWVSKKMLADHYVNKQKAEPPKSLGSRVGWNCQFVVQRSGRIGL